MNKFLANLITLSILITSQTVYIVLPAQTAAGFALVRPLFYLLAFVIHFALTGKDERVVPKAAKANLIAGCGVFFYLAVTFLAGVISGFAVNAAAASFSAVLRNIWIYGTMVLISEILRYKIIKNSPVKYQTKTSYLLIIVYTFVQLDTLKNLLINMSYRNLTDYFFSALFLTLALNAALCYIAFEGSLFSLIIIRFTYSMFPILSPFLPNINETTWAMTTCGVLLLTVIFYYTAIKNNSEKSRRKAKRQAKYQRNSKSLNTVIFGVIILIIAFTLRAFVYFPVVILTGSMSGTMDTGSVVFVKKIELQEVSATIKTGDIILYERRNSEIMHRVIDIQYDGNGQPFYTTKGDANPFADPFHVEQSQVLGVSKSLIPYIGYPIVIINSALN